MIPRLSRNQDVPTMAWACHEGGKGDERTDSDRRVNCTLKPHASSSQMCGSIPASIAAVTDSCQKLLSGDFLAISRLDIIASRSLYPRLSWKSRRLRKPAASMESNSSSSGTGCKWSVPVLMLGGGQAESWNRPLRPVKKRNVRAEHVIYLVFTIDILDTK